MTDAPNFHTLARDLLRTIATAQELEIVATPDHVELAAQYLQVVWNARGAVDIAAIERELASMMGATAGGPYVKNLQRTLRALDR